jgi:TolA-binding protein
VIDRDLGGPMPEDLRDLLDAERALEAPKADTRERLLERLAPLLLLPPGGLPDSAVPTDSATAGATKTLAHAGWRAKVLIPVLSAALGSAGGAATHAYLTRSTPHAPAPSRKLEATPAQAPAPKAASAAPQQGTGPEATPAAPNFGPTPATPPPPSSTGTLRGERLLLESATAALLRGDPTTALGTLQKHARQYPHGALSEEREVLWVKALRAQGNEAAAEKRANDFKRRFPSSLQQGALDNRGGSQ